MAVIKKRRLFTLLLLSVSSIGQTMAKVMEAGKSSIKLLFNLYHQNSTTGKQVVDNSGREEANVFEPMLFMAHQIDEKTNVKGKIVFDAWTAASDSKLDASTGASSGEPIKGQSRISANLGASHEFKPASLSYGAGFSSEYDYKSLNGFFRLAKGFAQDNFTLSFTARYFKDQLKTFKSLNGNISDFEDRNILATSVGASQILTRNSLINFGFDFVRASGVMESTASTVNVAGVRRVESLPDSRSRYALSAKYIRLLTEESSLHFTQRLYTDQWGVNASTSQLNWYRMLGENENILEVSLRYHRQSASQYYSNEFAVAQTHMTSDSDIARFNSYEIGSRYKYFLDELKMFKFVEFEDPQLIYGLSHYRRTNGLHATTGQFALAVGF